MTLTLGQPSSVSVQGQIAPSTVALGESAEVRVTWTTGGVRPEYLEGVTVETNDRSKDQIRFTVRGRVRVQIGAAPERLAVADVPPGGTAKVSTVVYSQVWRDLQLAKASCSIPGAVCRVEPAGDDALSRLHAAAGLTLTVTVPGEMPSGPFTGVVRIERRMRPPHPSLRWFWNCRFPAGSCAVWPSMGTAYRTTELSTWGFIRRATSGGTVCS